MAMDKFPDEVTTIRQLLSGHTEGLTIRSIAAMLGMNRNSVAKYLDILQMQGGVTLKRSGPSKIYCLADKLPAAAVLRLAKSHVIIFNQTLQVTDINDSFLEFLNVSKKDIVGKALDLLPFAMQCHPEPAILIKEGIRGRENRVSAIIRMGDNTVPVMLASSPVFFENGNNGVSLTIDPEQDQKNGKISGIGTESTSTELDVSEYLCRFAPDGTLTYVNQAYCDLLHKTKTELIGHTWRPTIPESEVKKIKSCLYALNHANPVASLDLRAITPAGDSQWQRWKFRHLYDRQGQSAGYQGTGLDITELKKLELKVSKFTDEMENLIHERKTEIQDLNRQIYDEITSHEKTHFQLQFTQFAMDAASYMITWISREGRFIYMNRQAQLVLGYQYRDVISKKFQDLIAEVFPFPWDEIWKIIKQDRQYTIETALRTSKGIEIPVEMVLNYLEFKDKQYCCCFAKDISGRKRAEQALRESEQKYRDIFEKSVSGLFKTTPDGRLVDANDAFARMYGYSSSGEMLSAGLDVGRDLYANYKDRQEVLSLLADKGKVENYETQHMRRDGTLFWLAITARAIRDTDGAVIFYEGTYVDITERKRAEEALSEVARYSRNLIESSLDPLVAISPEGRITDVNTATEQVTGYSRDHLIGTDFSDYFTVPGEARRGYQKVFEQGVVRNFPLDIKNRDGTIRHMLYNAAVYRDGSGQVKGVFAAARDITDRKNAEETLRASREILEAILNSITVRVFWKDKNSVYLGCNTIFARDAGFEKPEDIIGKDDYAMGWHDQGGKYRADDQAVIVSGRSNLLFEEPQTTPYGETIQLLTSKVPLRDAQGEIIGVLGTYLDITERKRAEAALKESESKYRTLVENIPEKIFIKDASLAYVSCNEPFAQDLGIAADAIAGKTDFDFYPGDLAEKYRKDDRAVMESGAASRIEERYTVQGKDSWISILKTPLRDYAGNVTGILGIFHDITLRKQTDDDIREKTFQQLQASYEKLQETEANLLIHQTELEVQNEELRKTQHNLEISRERYFELYDLAPAGYLTLSDEGLILNVNLTAATMLGVERRALEKKPLTRFIVPGDQDIFYHCRKMLMQTRNRQSCELRLLQRERSPLPVQIIAMPSPPGERDQAVISLMIIDIPERKTGSDEIPQNQADNPDLGTWRNMANSNSR